MDLGVGSFVFSQGIISAIPIIKDDNYLSAPLIPQLFATLRKTFPLLILGIVRVVLVKSTDYPVRNETPCFSKLSSNASSQEHISEYGVHWNFFLTMALLPAFQVIMHPIIRRMPISWVGGLLTLGMYINASLMLRYSCMYCSASDCIVILWHGDIRADYTSDWFNQFQQRRNRFPNRLVP